MNLSWALQILLISANPSSVFGGGVRAAEKEQERNLSNVRKSLWFISPYHPYQYHAMSNKTPFFIITAFQAQCGWDI